ncbi:15-hydroxyprostaglandin dehydrogenase [NAD(+)]-like [Ostrinia nubilalis]|uniref:15-hydroxyprostaglandin dehydrogenase [NAD(+)]-like n=1 Tax=Ostrinia nubilalis TaxID=29057 RepID=UPI00308255B7
MYEVKNKVFFITGGAAGIGAGVVKVFLGEGAKHVAILDVDVKNGTALEAELIAKYGADKVKFYKCDITTSELNDTYDAVLKQCGYIDTVVNCAGILNDNANVYMKAIAVNMTALITSSLRAYDIMRKDHGGTGGTIINISSIGALFQDQCLPIYHATKSAVLQFSLCLGMEPTYSRTGVRVVTLCFGCTDTSLLTTNKADSFDPDLRGSFFDGLKVMPTQTTENAVRGLVEAYKRGASASTWLVSGNKPAEDISANVKEAYAILSRGITD